MSDRSPVLICKFSKETYKPLPDNLSFGGGAGASTITPFVLACVLAAGLLVLILPRKFLIAPILVVVFLTPFGQQVYVAGFHLFVFRLLILVGSLRLLLAKFTGKPLFGGGFNNFDKLFYLWAFLRGMAVILLYQQGGAVINQVGVWLDAFGGYFLFRYALQDDEDILRATKIFASIAAVLAICMTYEFLTRVNVFSYLAGHSIEPWLRNGRVRAQAVFGNSITAGTMGATLLPLFFWLWKSGKARFLAIIGLASASVVAITSMSSTPVTGYLAAILGLCLWPVRRHMRKVRWGLVFAVIGLALVMKAPIWYIITRVNIVGGQSWDRANLIDQTMRHLGGWWLLGTRDNASWGDFTWDQCNQYINEGLQGGIATMLLFFAIISRGFGMLGKNRKRAEGSLQEWYFWCLGAALFAHVICFLGIDYFDQTRILWFVFLAMISAATAPALSEGAASENQAAGLSSVRFRFASAGMAPRRLALANFRSKPEPIRPATDPGSSAPLKTSQDRKTKLTRHSGFNER
jgi:hypothetical protein